MTSLVLSSAPLSEEFRTRIRERLDEDLAFTYVAEIRRQPLFAALRRLRSTATERCYIAMEDDSSAAVLPLLHALASATLPRRLQLIRQDLSLAPLSPVQLPPAAAAMVLASVNGAFAKRAAQRELSRLIREPRVAVRPASLNHLLFLNANLWFGLKVGGSVGHVAGVVNAFSRHGLDVTLATAPESIMIDPSVAVKRLPPPATLGLPFELNYYSFQRKVVQAVSEETMDLCYQRLSIGSYAGVMISRMRAVPLILEYNGSEAWAARYWGRRLRFESLAIAAEDACLRHAHIVVTVSNVLRDELLARGVGPDRIVCHPNGVDPTIFEPNRFSPADAAAIRRQHDVPESALVVTFLGTFGRWHGADVLARAIRRLADTRSNWLAERNVRFMFVGDGPLRRDVQEIVRSSKAVEFVRFTGLVPQAAAPAYLSASDVVVAPHVPNSDGSRFFGSPTKLFEYMAMGRAIIASDLDQIGAVLCDGIDVRGLKDTKLGSTAQGTGLLTPPGDEQSLAEGIAILVDDPLLRATLGRNARQLVLRHYTWDHHVAAILGRMELLRTEGSLN